MPESKFIAILVKVLEVYILVHEVAWCRGEMEGSLGLTGIISK